MITINEGSLDRSYFYEIIEREMKKGVPWRHHADARYVLGNSNTSSSLTAIYVFAAHDGYDDKIHVVFGMGFKEKNIYEIKKKITSFVVRNKVFNGSRKIDNSYEAVFARRYFSHNPDSLEFERILSLAPKFIAEMGKKGSSERKRV